MKVGLNTRYLLHTLRCREWVSKSLKILVLSAVLSSLVFAFPVETGVVAVPGSAGSGETAAIQESTTQTDAPIAGIAAIERLLGRYGVDEEIRPRVARAIMTSSKKYDVDPTLVASILIIESRGNPFAVSEAGAMGIMQIHLGTWGPLVDEQGINLFNVEDNVDLGVRILKGYMDGSGVWDGVARYKGRTETPESYESAAEYVRKVQRIYGVDPDAVALR